MLVKRQRTGSTSHTECQITRGHSPEPTSPHLQPQWLISAACHLAAHRAGGAVLLLSAFAQRTPRDTTAAVTVQALVGCTAASACSVVSILLTASGAATQFEGPAMEDLSGTNTTDVQTTTYATGAQRSDEAWQSRPALSDGPARVEAPPVAHCYLAL